MSRAEPLTDTLPLPADHSEDSVSEKPEESEIESADLRDIEDEASPSAGWRETCELMGVEP